MLKFLRVESNEIYLFRFRYAGLLVLATLAVVLAGLLSQKEVPARGVVFNESMTPAEIDQITTYLTNFSNVTFDEVATSIDPAELRRQDAAFGLGKTQGQITAVWNPAASEQVSIQLAVPPQSAGQPAAPEAAPSEVNVAIIVREALLAGANPISPPTLAAPHILVTKVLVFVSVFAPFLFALESFVRQRQNQVQPVYLAGARGAWFAYCVAKIIAAMLAGLVVLVAGLSAAGAFFELLPSEGLFAAAGLYLLAALASASLGIAIGATIESNRALGAVSGYFLALLLFGGVFLPLSSASPLVDAASFAFPLRYPLNQFHQWLLQGQTFDPIGDLMGNGVIVASGFELSMFIGLVAVYLLLVPAAMLWRLSRS